MDCFRLRSPSFGGLPTRRSLRSKRRRVVALLLAMTVNDMRSHPRGTNLSGLCVFIGPLCRAGAGKAGCRRHPHRRVRRRATRDAHGFDRYSLDIPAFPARWLYGLLRALPGERPFLPPLPMGRFPTDVAPGSRRQDHATSPYAAGVSSGEGSPRRPAPIATRADVT